MNIIALDVILVAVNLLIFNSVFSSKIWKCSKDYTQPVQIVYLFACLGAVINFSIPFLLSESEVQNNVHAIIVMNLIIFSLSFLWVTKIINNRRILPEFKSIEGFKNTTPIKKPQRNIPSCNYFGAINTPGSSVNGTTTTERDH